MCLLLDMYWNDGVEQGIKQGMERGMERGIEVFIQTFQELKRTMGGYKTTNYGEILFESGAGR